MEHYGDPHMPTALARRIFTHLLLTLFLAAAVLAQAPSGVMAPVLTRAFDNSRTGLNPHETTFTQATVRTRGIRRLATLALPGDARGTEGQPLILPSVRMADGATHDLVLISAMDNTVRAFDANTFALLWQRSLGNPVQGSAAIDMHRINDHWGVLSTGVLDPATATWYGVALTSPDGTPQRGSHAVYAIDLRTGQLAAPPAPLAGQTYQPPQSGTKPSPLQRWDATMRKQRSSLVMTSVAGRKTLFFGAGTVLETTAGAAGWIFAYDLATHRITASVALSAGYGAGLWMAGQGLCADANGDLFGVTGNGSFDPASGDFGESAIKLRYTPPTSPTRPGKLAVIDNWTPYTDAGRMGEPVTRTMPAVVLQNKLSGISAPSEAAKPVNSAHMPESMTDMAEPTNRNEATETTLVPTPGKPHAMRLVTADALNPAFADEDWGAGGGFLIPKYGIYGAAGKDGILYLMHAANLGGTRPVDFANAKANYAKLVQYPQWFTYYDPQVDPAPQDPTTLDILPDGKTRHDHSTPVQFESGKWGAMLFCWGENSNLRAWAITAAGVQFLAQGNEVASANVPNSPGGMPGGFMSLSSNNGAPGTAVLWATVPYGDANATVTNGRLLAYDPENLITNPDGSRTITKLWDSQDWGITFLFNKFNPPIASGGKLFVPNYSGGVDVYGLAQ